MNNEFAQMLDMLTHAVSEIDEVISARAERVANGVEFNEYQTLCGEIRGLRLAKSFLEGHAERLKNL